MGSGFSRKRVYQCSYGRASAYVGGQNLLTSDVIYQLLAVPVKTLPFVQNTSRHFLHVRIWRDGQLVNGVNVRPFPARTVENRREPWESTSQTSIQWLQERVTERHLWEFRQPAKRVSDA